MSFFCHSYFRDIGIHYTLANAIINLIIIIVTNIDKYIKPDSCYME